MKAMAVGPKIEPHDLHVLFDRFSAFGLWTAFLKTSLYLLEKITEG
jgi:hypothetical protein